MATTEPSEWATKSKIIELVLAYWNDVDNNWGANAHAMFAPDGVFGSGASAFTGQQQIKAFYDWRRGRGERTARHLVNNAVVALHGPERASVRYVMTIYASVGTPILPMHMPNTISDVEEVFTRTPEGRWLIVSKTFTTLFKGEEPTTTMPAALRERLPADLGGTSALDNTPGTQHE